MRKLTGAVFISLDGVMQAPGGPDEDPTSGFRFGVGQGTGAKQFSPSYIDPTTGQRVFPPLAVGPNYSGQGYNILNSIANGTTTRRHAGRVRSGAQPGHG